MVGLEFDVLGAILYVDFLLLKIYRQLKNRIGSRYSVEVRDAATQTAFAECVVSDSNGGGGKEGRGGI